MATKRGKSQARRNTGNSGGLPGWAWLVLGIALTIVVVLAAPRFLKSGTGDGFFRPRPNPDAQPAIAAGNDDAVAPDSAPSEPAAPKTPDKPKPTQYDFYTLLPGNEVVMSDAELAATARSEATRHAKAQKVAPKNDAAKDPSSVVAVNDGNTSVIADASSTSTPSTIATTSVGNATPNHPGNDTPYILQAGAFGASGDAEAIKAKVALLGLSARVEAAAINGKTVYRVRMGPYATASELAEAKRKLGNGGLPALAIKAK